MSAASTASVRPSATARSTKHEARGARGGPRPADRQLVVDVDGDIGGQYAAASYHAQPMNSRAGRALIVGAVAAVAILAAWFVPPLAVVVVWPLFLFLPGWSATRLLGPRIDAAGRISLAVVGSVAVGTHLVNAVSWIVGGYGRAAVFIAAALLMAAVVWIESARGGRRLPRLGPGLRAALPVAVAGMAVVGVTLGVGLWRMTDTGVSSGGSNWSDLGVHLSIAETLNAGRQLPARGAVLRGCPARLPLVRRLPRRDPRRGSRDLQHPGHGRPVDRAHRGPGARCLQPGAPSGPRERRSPDRRPGRGVRRLRRWHGLGALRP